MIDFFFFLSALVLFYYPSRIIQSDASFIGQYHLVHFLNYIRNGRYQWLPMALFFSMILQSSYRVNISFKTFYINRLLSLDKTTRFLLFRELGKPIFITFFLILSLNPMFFMAIIATIGFILYRINYIRYNRFFYSIFMILIGLILIEREETLQNTVNILFFLKNIYFLKNDMFLLLIGLGLGIFLKDSLIFFSLSFFFIFHNNQLSSFFFPLLIGFVWGESLVSFLLKGNHFPKRFKLFLSYCSFLLFFSIFVFISMWYNPEHFFLNYLISNICGVFSSVLFLPWIISLIRAFVNKYFPTDKYLHGDTLADRRILKAAEVNLVLARRLLRKKGDDCFKMLFNFLKYSDDNLDGYQKLIIKNDEILNNMEKYNKKIEFILDKTSGLSLHKKTYGEMKAVNEISNYQYLIAKSIIKMVRKFRDLNKENLLENKEKFYIIESVRRVMDFINYTNDFIHGRIKKFDLKIAHNMEKEIDIYKNKMNQYAVRIFKKDSIVASILFFDIIKYIEHMGDFSLGISKQLNYFYYEQYI